MNTKRAFSHKVLILVVSSLLILNALISNIMAIDRGEPREHETVDLIQGAVFVRNVEFNRNENHPDFENTVQNVNWSFKVLTVNGKVVYCLDPEAKIPTGKDYESSLDWGYLTQSQKEAIIKTSNYGYGYKGDYSMANYWATQNRIWEIAGWNANWGSLDASKEYALILDLVAKHDTVPVWDDQTIEVKYGETIDLGNLSSSNFLQPKSLPKGVEVVENNEDTFKVLISDPEFISGTILFEKDAVNEVGGSIVYRKPGEQTVLSVYNDYPVSATIHLKRTTGGIEIEKQDKEGSSYGGVVFELSRDRVTIDSVHTTDKHGKISLAGLELGTYYFREKSVVEPLILNSTWHSVDIISEEISTVVVVNDRAQGRIRGTKKTNHGMPLSGVTYEIRDGFGSVVETLRTDNLGQFESSLLDLGNYTIVETSVPEGIVLDDTLIEVKIEYAGELVSITEVDLELVNEYQRANVKLTKMEDASDPNFIENHHQVIEGVEIALYATVDIYEGDTLIFREGERITRAFTDAFGVVSFNNIPFGKYYLMELYSPSGYHLFEGRWDIELVSDSTNPYSTHIISEFEIYNAPVLGSVVLRKLDLESREQLEGAVFELRQAKDDSVLGVFTSDINGEIRVDGLRFSSEQAYYFIETSAPQNYVLDDTKLFFDIHDAVQVVTLESSNVKKPKTSLPKTGMSANKVVFGGSLLVIFGLISVYLVRKRTVK